MMQDRKGSDETAQANKAGITEKMRNTQVRGNVLFYVHNDLAGYSRRIAGP